MVRQRLMYMVCTVAILSLAVTSYADTVNVSDFESGLGGWDPAGAPTLSLSSATGSQAMQIEAASGWQNSAKLDAKAFKDLLAKKNVRITADVVASPNDMTVEGYFQVVLVVNADGVGWNNLDFDEITVDGQTHTYTWHIPDSLATAITDGPASPSYFELWIISNAGGATKFSVDNIKISYPSMVITDFESGFGAWAPAGAPTLTLSSATGSQAMLIEAASGWQNSAKADVKAYKDAMANRGVTITADVTAYPADMTVSGYFQVVMVVNGDGIGWNNLDFDEITVDGWTHTYTWKIPDSLADAIAEGPASPSYFELWIISNAGGATKFYIDNIWLNNVPVATEAPPKSTDMVIGNWEESMDGWVVGGADVRYNDHNGVTLDNYSLDVWVETGAWNQSLLTLDLLDPNNAAVLEALKINSKISVDVTRLVADWPSGTEEGANALDWNEMLLIFDFGGDGFQLDWDVMTGSGNWAKKASWLPRNGEDETTTATWDYSQFLPDIDFDTLTWCTLSIGVNANDEDYTGWVLFYLDNMRLTGAGVAMIPQPANGARGVSTKGSLSWSGGTYATAFNVYIGTDSAEVAAAKGATNANVKFATVDVNSFTPEGLDYNMKYFWRVDAVNDVNPDSPWTGSVWNFTTAKGDILDDFESYTNESPHRVFQTWRDALGFSPDEFFPDGYDGNGTGAAVGNDPTVGDIMDKTNPHSGAQAMPVFYDNTETGISEATRTFAEPQNFSEYESMSIWIRGLAENVDDMLYVRLKDSAGKVEEDPDLVAGRLTNPEWTEWSIPMGNFSTVNLESIVELTIGVGSTTSPKASSGEFFVDDVWLYPLVLIRLEPDYLTVEQTATAPVIDGVGDGVWDGVTAVPMLIWDISNAASAEPESAADLSASFKVCYDDTNFYLFLEVLDSVIDTSDADEWEKDGLEVYFDGDYSHGDTYDGVNDNQIRITVDDVDLSTVQSNTSIEGTQFKVLLTPGGYNIEASFPLSALQIYPTDDPAPILDANGDPIPGTGIAARNVIGFEIQLNESDVPGSGTREGMLRWHSDDNNSYANPSLFGQARFVRTMVGN